MILSPSSAWRRISSISLSALSHWTQGGCLSLCHEIVVRKNTPICVLTISFSWLSTKTVIDEGFFAESLFNPRNDEWRPKKRSNQCIRRPRILRPSAQMQRRLNSLTRRISSLLSGGWHHQGRMLAATERKRSATRSGVSPLLMNASAPEERAAC